MIIPIIAIFQGDDQQVSNTANLQQYKEYFFNGSQFDWLSIPYLSAGVIVCFLYVALNKFYFYHSQTEVIENDPNQTAKKFPNIGLIWNLKFRSIIFRICFFYGLFASALFLSVVLLDQSHIIDIQFSKDLLSSTGLKPLDSIIAGVVFGFGIYPLLSSRIIGSFGFEGLVDLFANPSDARILDEISIARNREIRNLVVELDQKLKKENKDASYGVNELKYHLIIWNDHLNKLDDDILFTAITDAIKKYGEDEVVNIALSVARSVGFDEVRTALKYPVFG